MKTISLTKTDGRVSVSVDLDYLFSTLRNGRYEMTIKRSSERRTVSQNDLMWMWMACIERETGTPKDDAYLYYCKLFLSKAVKVGDRETMVYETSSKLDTRRMSEFLERIQADAASELGIQLPSPQDRYFESFYEDYR